MTRTATQALTLEAGAGHVTVAGLTADEARLIRDQWSRCDPREAAANDTADLTRQPDEDWTLFHERLVYQATSAAITASRGHALMLHAAALALPDTGATLALTAPSGTGKTTATRVLGQHLAYLTDETTIVDPETLDLTPYPKPLSILGPSRARPKTQHSPDDLQLGAAVPARLSRVALLDRVRDAEADGTARAEPLPLEDVLSALVPQSSSLSRLPRGLVTLCRVLDELGGGLRLIYREADDLLPLVEGLLASPPEPITTPAWTALDAEQLQPSRVDSDAESAAVRYGRRRADDGMMLDDGRTVLLRDTTLTVLDGVGPALWDALAHAGTASDVVGRLTEHGPVPDDAAERVQAALDGMVERGLVDAL
ncbi:MAG: PqqD family peptide modification chaperone [Micrococcus sp.]|nr:PqqD family peptide modification chaperone [Micrococcus sp.]